MKEKEKTKVVSSGGIGLGSLLCVLFVGLKLANIGVVATWSWVWVLSPLWIPIVLVIGVVLIIGIIAGIASIFSK